MGYVQYNPNPNGTLVGDCVVRALSRALDQSWEKTYVELSIQGFVMGDMPSSNGVWGEYLRGKGYERHVIPNTCPDCYTVYDFAQDHPDGDYIVATGTHVVAVSNGDYYDSWPSGKEMPTYYWVKKGVDEDGVSVQ